MPHSDPASRETPAAPVVTLPGGPASAPESARRRRRRIGAAVLLIALTAAGFAGWRLFFAPPGPPPSIIATSGRIEGDDAVVAAKTSGRIREITGREGDLVQSGQLLAVLDGERIHPAHRFAPASSHEAGSARPALLGVAPVPRQADSGNCGSTHFHGSGPCRAPFAELEQGQPPRPDLLRAVGDLRCRTRCAAGLPRRVVRTVRRCSARPPADELIR
jgi:hypothetical protein